MLHGIRGRLRELQTDDGVGLVEVVVAMFVLAIILVGFLPFLTDSIRYAVKSQTLAAANRLVAAQLGAERNNYETNECAPIPEERVLINGAATVPTPDGGTLAVTHAVSCVTLRSYDSPIVNPDGSPGTLRVNVTMATVTVRAKYAMTRGGVETVQEPAHATTKILRTKGLP